MSVAPYSDTQTTYVELVVLRRLDRAILRAIFATITKRMREFGSLTVQGFVMTVIGTSDRSTAERDWDSLHV